MLEPRNMSYQIHTYEELKRQLHNDLRTQHPEWIQPNRKCPKCDEHEARLNELLEGLVGGESKTEGRQQVLSTHARHEIS
jgi:hypothetical protein